jgi:hypothetical protein
VAGTWLLLLLQACDGGSTAPTPPPGSGPTPPPSTGTIQVTVHTIGALPDPDGYSLTLDGDALSASAIGANGVLTIPRLSDGIHSLRLSGVAANCALTGDNPKKVDVTPPDQVDVVFELDCPAFGSLRIGIVTTGSDLDPNGYQLTLDDLPPQTVNTNSTVTLDVTAGTHTLRLLDAAPNCVVNGAVRTVTVVSAGETQVDFEITCSAIPSSGNLIITVSTQVINWTGFNFQFGVVVDQQPKRDISPNGTLDISVVAGTHSVFLKIPQFCGVGLFGGPSTNPITVEVPRVGTATAHFSVLCIG